MGWNYAMSFLVVPPFELTATSVTIGFWDPDNAKYNVGVWITVFLVFVIIINIFGVRGYGEVEFYLGLIKVLAVIGFILTAIIIDCGGVSTDKRYYLINQCLAKYSTNVITGDILEHGTGMHPNRRSRMDFSGSALFLSLLTLPSEAPS
jgi:amino acid permease